MQSPKFSLNQQDIEKFARNALIFIAPALILILTQYSQTQTVNWDVVGLYVINLVIDLLRKFIAGTTA